MYMTEHIPWICWDRKWRNLRIIVQQNDCTCASRRLNLNALTNVEIMLPDRKCLTKNNFSLHYFFKFSLASWNILNVGFNWRLIPITHVLLVEVRQSHRWKATYMYPVCNQPSHFSWSILFSNRIWFLASVICLIAKILISQQWNPGWELISISKGFSC